MEAIQGTVRNGQISLAEPVSWPDGTLVRIKPIPTVDKVRDDVSFDMSDDVQKNDPDSIARWLAEFDAISPLQMTPDEEASWQVARDRQKELDQAKHEERIKVLRGIWE